MQKFCMRYDGFFLFKKVLLPLILQKGGLDLLEKGKEGRLIGIPLSGRV